MCGRVISAKRALDRENDWLVAPHRTDPGLLVIRCPDHWSVWALRLTVLGRKKPWLDRMKEIEERNKSRPWTPPHLDPAPMYDTPDSTLPGVAQ